MNQTLDFGLQTWNLDCLVMGAKTLQEFLDGRVQLVNFLGMDMAGMAPDIRTYPVPDGRGGQGHSLFQPFVEPKQVPFINPKLIHQPFITSFMVIDIWPEHFTVTIKSCIRFAADAVCAEIRRIFGPVLDCHSWTLGPAARGMGEEGKGCP